MASISPVPGSKWSYWDPPPFSKSRRRRSCTNNSMHGLQYDINQTSTLLISWLQSCSVLAQWSIWLLSGPCLAQNVRIETLFHFRKKEVEGDDSDHEFHSQPSIVASHWIDVNSINMASIRLVPSSKWPYQDPLEFRISLRRRSCTNSIHSLQYGINNT